MPKGDKTKGLWENPKYRKHMSEAHKGQEPTNIEQLREINYKGENIMPRSIHKYFDKNYVKTDCVVCGSNGGKKRGTHWASLTNHKYTRDIKDYICLCSGCHQKWDNGNLAINLFEWRERMEVVSVG